MHPTARSAPQPSRSTGTAPPVDRSHSIRAPTRWAAAVSHGEVQRRTPDRKFTCDRHTRAVRSSSAASSSPEFEAVDGVRRQQPERAAPGRGQTGEDVAVGREVVGVGDDHGRPDAAQRRTPACTGSRSSSRTRATCPGPAPDQVAEPIADLAREVDPGLPALDQAFPPIGHAARRAAATSSDTPAERVAVQVDRPVRADPEAGPEPGQGVGVVQFLGQRAAGREVPGEAQPGRRSPASRGPGGGACAAR